MKILIVHNFYQQPGGEDAVFKTESSLLEAYGHQITHYTIHNDAVAKINAASVAAATVWNHSTYSDLKQLLLQTTPQIVHFHNTFPLISPSAYYAVQSLKIPIVQTLHNYRLLCPNGEFFRGGKVCEDCLDKLVPWPSIAHACYRHNRLASSAVTTMLTLHRLMGTWEKAIDRYIVLTDFARKKFVEAGLPAEKLIIKPNFVHPAPAVGSGKGGYALFVGRLAVEKGIHTLLKAWKQLGCVVPLKIVGDGPLADQVQQATRQYPGIHWLGRRSPTEVYELMGDAAFLIFPSEWYEGLPRTIVESFAVGTPVIASNLGAMSSLIRHGVTGLHFQAGSSTDLVAQVEWAVAHPKEIADMRQAARAEYEEKYTAEINYRKLIEIYHRLV